MKTERGFTMILYLVLILGILGMIATAALKIYEAGREAEQVAQAERERKEAAELAVFRGKRQQAWRETSAKAAKATDDANLYRRKWKESKDAAKFPLAECPKETTADSPRRDVLLTHGFLRLYDGAWTGDKGQPVFGDSTRPPETAPPAATASARSLGDLLRVHEENAAECADTAQRYNKLIDRIEFLTKLYDEKMAEYDRVMIRIAYLEARH